MQAGSDAVLQPHFPHPQTTAKTTTPGPLHHSLGAAPPKEKIPRPRESLEKKTGTLFSFIPPPSLSQFRSFPRKWVQRTRDGALAREKLSASSGAPRSLAALERPPVPPVSGQGWARLARGAALRHRRLRYDVACSFRLGSEGGIVRSPPRGARGGVSPLPEVVWRGGGARRSAWRAGAKDDVREGREVIGWGRSTTDWARGLQGEGGTPCRVAVTERSPYGASVPCVPIGRSA